MTDDLPRSRITGAFERRVATALHAHLAEDEPIVVACSGGADSTAALVATTRALGPGRVTAAYFDHRLRASGDAERAAVEALAGHLGVAFRAGRAPRVPAKRGEAEAREARYRWLARACGEAAVGTCVTGHTLDDQAETVILRLARGTGLGGAAGMAEAAPWPVQVRGASRLRVVRPLLGVTRAATQRYTQALGLQALVDPTNEAVEYARNRVRQRVLPELRAINPRAAEQIADFAARARADDAALEAIATEWCAVHLRASEGGVAVERRALLALPQPVAARVVRLACARLGVPLEARGVEAVLVAARRRGSRVALPRAEAVTGGILLEMRRIPLPG